jgi:hypothetical protein
MTGYTRQDSNNNIANGNVIDADDLDAEFNALADAFNETSGHTHDGSLGGGVRITEVGPSGDLTVSASRVDPLNDNVLSLGSSTGAQFKDAYFKGTLVGKTAIKAGTNGYMTLTDNQLDVSNGDLTFDIDGNIVIDTDGGNITLKDGGTTFGGVSNDSGQTVIKSGSTPTPAITLSDADTTLEGNVTVSGTLDVTSTINFNNTTTSTSTTTGSVVIDGGVGIANNVYIGGDLDVSGTNKNITGNLKGDVKSTNGTTILDSGTDGTDAAFTGDVTGNADTATTWETAREIELTGDVTGTVTGVNGGGDISIATTIAENSVALGTDTTGNYVASLVAGTGITLTNNSGEGATPTVEIGQDVSTTSDVTFNDVTIDGNLTVSGSTTTVLSEVVNIEDSIITLNSNLANNVNPPDNADAGISVNRGALAAKTFYWDESEDKWTVGSETLVASTFEGDLTGDVTGNADTSTTAGQLTTARTITLGGDLTGSASFDGSADVTISATVSSYSHTHSISDVTGLQTEIDTKAELAGDAAQSFSASTLNATTVDLGDWTITESSGVLYFATTAGNKMKLDANGNLTVTGDITAYGTV